LIFVSVSCKMEKNEPRGGHPMDAVRIVPCKEEYVADCARISVTSYEIIHREYAKFLGQEIHDGAMANWQEAKARSIEAQQRGKNAIVALLGDTVVGFASYVMDGIVGEITNNAVDPIYRGNGIGTKLYRAVLDAMRAEGAIYARVHTGGDDGHAPARHTYQKAGFDRSLPTVTLYQKLENRGGSPAWRDGVQIMPCSPVWTEDCVRIGLAAWEGIHDAYSALLGKDFHDAVMANWREEKAETIRAHQNGSNAYVAVADGQVVGFISYRVDCHVGQILENAVDPVCRGRGIAGLMYNYVLDAMYASGAIYARVQTGRDAGHAPARRAYEKAGFDHALPNVLYFQKL